VFSFCYQYNFHDLSIGLWNANIWYSFILNFTNQAMQTSTSTCLGLSIGIASSVLHLSCYRFNTLSIAISNFWTLGHFWCALMFHSHYWCQARAHGFRVLRVRVWVRFVGPRGAYWVPRALGPGPNQTLILSGNLWLRV